MLQKHKNQLSSGTAPASIAAHAGQPQASEQPTPEEIEQHQRFMENAFRLIYSEKTLPATVKMLGGGGDPVRGLAGAAVQVTLHNLTQARRRGVEVSDDVLFASVKEITEDLATLATEEGIEDFRKNREGLERAYHVALDDLRGHMTLSGMIDQGKEQQRLKQFQQMDEAGELRRVLESLDAADIAASKPKRRGLGPARAA